MTPESMSRLFHSFRSPIARLIETLCDPARGRRAGIRLGLRRVVVRLWRCREVRTELRLARRWPGFESAPKTFVIAIVPPK
jgi:hypothetical protein